MGEAAANENVEQVQHEILEAPIFVYNFQVEDYHTYYVTDSGVLVHNMCYEPIRKNDMRAVINLGEAEAPRAHIFKKQENIGRIFRDGEMDKSLKNNRNAIRFLSDHYEKIMELIDKFYGKH